MLGYTRRMNEIIMNRPNRLILDCDGVLADFDKLAFAVLGMPSSQYEAQHGAKAFWKELRHYSNGKGWGFFESLPLMPDAMELFEAVKHLDPFILTGCPFGNWAPEQKLRWAERMFPGVEMITCMAKDKSLHMNQGDILIDDREKHRQAWEDAGGIWITHTSAKSSIEQLRAIKPEWFL